MATATAANRNLVLKMSVSPDGFLGGPNGEDDWIFRTMGYSTDWVVDTLRVWRAQFTSVDVSDMATSIKSGS
jgi:hypothetical protein